MPVAARRTVNTSRARRPAIHDDEDEAGTSAQGSSSSRVVANGHNDAEDGIGDDSTNALGSSSSAADQAPLSATQVRQQVTNILEDFERQSYPITRNEHDQSIKSMHAEWKTMEMRTAKAMELMANLAERKADMAMAIDEDIYGTYGRQGTGAAERKEDLEREEEGLKELDASYSKLVDLRESVDRSRSALQELRTQLEAGPADDAASKFERTMEERTSAYNNKSRRARYGHSKEYEQYKTQVWGARHGDEHPMPPFVEILEKEDGHRLNEGQDGEAQGDAAADGDSDEDIVAYGASTAQTFKCPISQQIMVDPLRSTVCAHAYERQAIHEYLARHATRNCPQCSARLSKQTLQEDAGFTRACRNYARRVERRRARDRMQTQAAILD